MPANEPSVLIKSAFHEAGHAAVMILKGIASVFAITVDTDMNGQYPDGEVEPKWLRDANVDEEGMILLAGPLAELKCIANHEQQVEWKFHPQAAINGISVHGINVSATFEGPDGVTRVITANSDPFETDFGQVRAKADTAAVVDQRVTLTQDWIDVPANWHVVQKLANALVSLKGKPVLRRQLFGRQITDLLK